MPKPSPKPIALNEEQQAVVSLGEGRFSCLAGPGSGKTAVLVQRTVRFLQEGVSPDDLLNLSFTNTAAKNLTDRVEAQVGKLTTTRKAGATTLHGLSLAFAIEERNEFGFDLQEFPLATEPVANKLSAEAGRRFEVDRRTLRSYVSLRKRERVRATTAVKRAEDKLDAAELKLALAYKQYDKALREAGVLDFDSLILEMVEILDKKPAVRQRWVRDWIQVDEAQDCAYIEWELIRLISGKSVLCVGDCSQGIYGFRGSDPKLFADMGKIFSGCQTLFLGTNYRSSPQIVEFIKPYAASEELSSRFRAHKTDGPVPKIVGFLSPADECAYVIKQIQEAI